jgi:hypothetical protein
VTFNVAGAADGDGIGVVDVPGFGAAGFTTGIDAPGVLLPPPPHAARLVAKRVIAIPRRVFFTTR